MVFVER